MPKILVGDAPVGAIIQPIHRGCGPSPNYYRLGPKVKADQRRPAWKRFRQGKTFLCVTNECNIIHPDEIEGFEEFK